VNSQDKTLQAGLLSYPIEFEGIKSRLFSCTRMSGNSIVFQRENLDKTKKKYRSALQQLSQL
jgi:hypothetical protein